MRAFDRWLSAQAVVQTRQFRASSRATYQAFFATWVRFLEARQVDLLEATPADAAAYFAGDPGAPLEPVSRRRYLQLFDRVYQDLRQLGLTLENPMYAELRRERTLPTAAPAGLSDDQLVALVGAVAALQGWKGVRDPALLALLAGAGLRANEVVALTRSAVSLDYRVKVNPAGVHRAHESVLLPAWRPAWTRWEAERAALGVPGQLAFPSTRAGKGYSESGLFRRIDTWIAGAGLVLDAGRGALLLRNTFARLALERYPAEQVQEFLGHEELRATQRHQPKPG